MSSDGTLEQDSSDVSPGTTSYPYTDGFAFGRTVVPVPLHNKPTKWGKLGGIEFEYREHSYIGDAINLKMLGNNIVPAKDQKLPLPNGLQLTYGEINGLAGDFYGTKDPISDGTNLQEQQSRFLDAYRELAERVDTPDEAKEILAILKTEIDAVNQALHDGKDPSTVYASLPDVDLKLQEVTLRYRVLEPKHPSYLGLANINWDHFGPDARTAYNAGHAVALQTAKSGDLYVAYIQNAFADHFLEDSFSSGHLRTPRRGLHGPYMVGGYIDMCAKYMHDEDNAIGLKVSRPDGESWTCYGDKRALDKCATINYARCVEAVQASADEIYYAWRDKVVPTPDKYKVWTLAPTLESALAPQTLAAFFGYKQLSSWSGNIDRRMHIRDRRNNARVDPGLLTWTYDTTALTCKTSGWWSYPITMDGPKSENSELSGETE